jgi:hypothetical protein
MLTSVFAGRWRFESTGRGLSTCRTISSTIRRAFAGLVSAFPPEVTKLVRSSVPSRVIVNIPSFVGMSFH